MSLVGNDYEWIILYYDCLYLVRIIVGRVEKDDKSMRDIYKIV